jgi:hypothetical protein
MVVILLILSTAAAFAQQNENNRVLAKLKNQKVTINFSETPLEEAISFFRDITGLNIIEAPGCLADIFINLRLKEIRLENALELALEPHGLDFMVRNGAVYIATQDEIYRLRGGSIRHILPDIKPDRLLLMLKDGSRIEGKVSFEKWKLKTAYGELAIPAHEIRGITLAREKPEGTVDEVETVRFSLTGRLDIDKIEIDTGKGKLTVPKKDIKTILFSRTLADKTFDVKATGEWLDTGIYLGKGSTVNTETTGEITLSNAQGESEIIMYPDGAKASVTKAGDEWKPPELHSKGFPLLAKIGKNGTSFVLYKIESKYSWQTEVKRTGNLYLKVRIPKGAEEAAKKSKGAYKTKVIVEK